MSDAKANYLENEILDHVLGTGAYTSPGTVYVALHTADPTDTGDLTNEVSTSSTGYARQSATFNAAASGTADNASDITFGPATSSWGTITHFSICDASTAGNVLYYGAFSTSKSVSTNDELKISAGNLSVSES